mmetsp:Transcript_42779/g.73750  ORF Transcript_42779/g.73750 Transcript_42779/m.73750 type:complete len:101 (+) Transcript_42779:123-425(+)
MVYIQQEDHQLVRTKNWATSQKLLSVRFFFSPKLVELFRAKIHDAWPKFISWFSFNPKVQSKRVHRRHHFMPPSRWDEEALSCLQASFVPFCFKELWVFP